MRIGTSGWHYKHWLGPFYPSGLPSSRMLAYYFERLDTVEINNSFYRLPKMETVHMWRAITPSDFVLAFKASRFLTHNKKLKDPEQPLERMLPLVDALGSKAGPVLFQLPPRWNLNLERLEAFLEALPDHYTYAFEFRNHTWHAPPVYKSLRKHNAAFCIYELAGFMSPCEITADFAYVRLHGPAGPYQGSYSRDALAGWRERFRRWGEDLEQIYVYFDNDMAGFAVQNAVELKRMMEE
jgi:uncharacterized protein YecE (DUF72 family)